MDELSPGARALLAAAEMSDDPTTEDAARVRRAVLANVGALGATAALMTTSTAQAKAASLLSVGAKLVTALALTAGGVAATWSYVHHQTSEAVATGPARPQVAAPPSALVTPTDTPAHPALPEPEPPVAPPSKALHPTPRAPRSAEKPDSAPSKPDVAVANLEAEMKLIRGADSALRAGRASEALALLAKHQAEHPHASLAHEREGLRAIAQCQTGASGSREVAERFLARSPRSPLAPRLRSACRIQE
jgi:hypothetical protein